ncbi:hypothetical protein [Streptomyces sp. NBC_01264]|uniref:hypothetical protein n=1 Tax=Streptomyces sp. NBC_01264 TaxID=2903804 RepID=UPI0022593179|nr:hypothetical protein [Streptomyces sp. NBC_01264]MCX4775474.1 hypothetical protein [Streptomyces sp. NBC_01264]
MFLGCALSLLVLLGLASVFLWQLSEHIGPQFAHSKGDPKRESLTWAEHELAEPRRAAMEALAKELQGESDLTEERLLSRTRAALAPPASARLDVRAASGAHPARIGLSEGRACINATIYPGEAGAVAEGHNPDGSCLPQDG